MKDELCLLKTNQYILLNISLEILLAAICNHQDPFHLQLIFLPLHQKLQ